MADEAVDYYIETGLHTEEFPFQWKIKDYFQKSPRSPVQIPTLTLEFKNSSVWELSLPVSSHGNSVHSIELHAKLTQILESPTMQQLTVGCEIGVVKNINDGRPSNRLGPVDKKIGEELRSGILAYVPTQDGKLNWSGLTINGELIIQGKLFVYERYSEQSVSLETITKKTEGRACSKVLKDFSNFLYWDTTGTENFSDVEITSNDGTVRYAHRCVLSARSEVFGAMFRSDMEESRTGELKLEDISGKAMEALLQFIYTGTIHEQWNDSEILPNLAYAAHKYQVKDLLGFFDEAFGKICDMNTVGPLLALSKSLELKTAEKDLREFAKRTMKKSLEKDEDAENVGGLVAMLKQFMA